MPIRKAGASHFNRNLAEGISRKRATKTVARMAPSNAIAAEAIINEAITAKVRSILQTALFASVRVVSNLPQTSRAAIVVKNNGKVGKTIRVVHIKQMGDEINRMQIAPAT